jgi:broad specificity phosphatase PhoE
MKIYLLRHGQTAAGLDYNLDLRLPDPKLDETGIRQAELLGKRLQRYPIEAIYSSDLERAKQTAQIINRYSETSIVLKSQLREIDMGEIPVAGWEAYAHYYAAWQKHEADLPYPGGEAGADVQKRIREVIDEITARYHHDVAVMTHGGVIMVMISACLGLGLEKRFRFTPPVNCSISTLVYDSQSGSIKVHQVNDSAHLESGFGDALG